jgi:hypothetical protein
VQWIYYKEFLKGWRYRGFAERAGAELSGTSAPALPNSNSSSSTQKHSTSAAQKEAVSYFSTNASMLPTALIQATALDTQPAVQLKLLQSVAEQLAKEAHERGIDHDTTKILVKSGESTRSKRATILLLDPQNKAETQKQTNQLELLRLWARGSEVRPAQTKFIAQVFYPGAEWELRQYFRGSHFLQSVVTRANMETVGDPVALAKEQEIVVVS